MSLMMTIMDKRHPTNPTFIARRKGFSLIELLVVISIIALLTSLLLPALKSARDDAQSTICRNNLKQLGAMTYSYIDDYDGLLPIFFDNTKYAYFNIFVKDKYAPASSMIMRSDYLYDCANTRRVPGSVWDCPVPGLVPPPDFWPAYGVSLGVFSNIHRRLSQYTKTSSQVLFLDWNRYYMKYANFAQALESGQGSPLRHRGRNNTIFLDGHIETLRNSDYQSGWFDHP